MKLRRRVRFLRRLLMFLMVFCLVGCGPVAENFAPAQETAVSQEPIILPEIPEISISSSEDFSPDFSVPIPEYAGLDVIVLRDNVPDFMDPKAESYESYSPLDALGRCGVAEACIGQDLMPTESRGEIGEVKPTGWIQAKYDTSVTGSDSPYLYNRCHLIGFQLTGENANERNLITGTRQLNVEMMLPYENMVTDYIKNTGNHVMYRVTPIFEGDELLARGIQMEAYSVEDFGAGIMFNVFCYNVERGITIDYSTGASSGPEFTGSVTSEEKDEDPVYVEVGENTTYVLNTNSGKFHKPDCDSVQQMSEQNRQEVTWSRQECIDNGYSPCGACKP